MSQPDRTPSAAKLRFYRNPGKVLLHVYLPGRGGVVLGDRVTRHRFALYTGRERVWIAWRYK